MRWRGSPTRRQSRDRGRVTPDVVVVGGGIVGTRDGGVPRGGRRAGHAVRADRDRRGRLRTELGRRPASVRPGARRPVPALARALPRPRRAACRRRSTSDDEPSRAAAGRAGSGASARPRAARRRVDGRVPGDPPEVVAGRALSSPGTGARRRPRRVPARDRVPGRARRPRRGPMRGWRSGSGARSSTGAAAVLAVDGDAAAGVVVDGRLVPAGAVVLAAGPWTAATAVAPRTAPGRRSPARGASSPRIALDRPPRHVLEELDDRHRAERRRRRPSGADAGLDFSLVTADGASALGSTFLPEPPGADRPSSAGSATAAPATCRRSRRRRWSGRAPAPGRSAPDGRPLDRRGAGRARRVRRRRPRAVGHLDRSRVGAPRRGPRPRARPDSPDRARPAPVRGAAGPGSAPPAARVARRARGS